MKSTNIYHKLKRFILTFLVLVYSALTFGGEFERASQLLKDKNYSSAVPILKKLANENHATALFKLGYIYRFGMGVEKDDSIAYQYFQSSGNLGYKPARLWQEVLIKSSDAFKNLPQEEKRKLRWKILSEACLQEGNDTACIKLAEYIRFNGLCGELCKLQEDKDRVARRYYSKAQQLGSIEGTYGLALTVTSEKQAIKEYQKVVDWVQSGGKTNNHIAAVSRSFDELAGRFYMGSGVETDRDKAFQYALHAADLTKRRGLVVSNTIVGLSFLNKDDRYAPEKAIAYLNWPAVRINSRTSIWTLMAANALYKVYWRGEGVEKSLPKAYKYVEGITKKFNNRAYFDYARKKDIVVQNSMLSIIKDAVQTQNKICKSLNSSTIETADCVYASQHELTKYEKELFAITIKNENKKSSISSSRNTLGSSINTWDFGDIITAGAAILVGSIILDSISEDGSSNASLEKVPEACRKRAINQVAMCEVRSTNCLADGCGQELVCSKSTDGVSGFVCTGFWERVNEGDEHAPPFYCDTKNPDNRSEHLHKVVKNICNN